MPVFWRLVGGILPVYERSMSKEASRETSLMSSVNSLEEWDESGEPGESAIVSNRVTAAL